MVSVGVFIDLRWTASAGGHVKCWEHFAEAATAFPDELDLTLHVLGHRSRVTPLSDNVRFVVHPFRFSTERIFFLQNVPDHTDLAPYNPALIPYLEQHQVVHTTHPLFTFGKTAYRYCRKTGKPLVTSIHTDTPQYARIYIEQTIAGLPTPPWFKRLLQDQLHIPARYQAYLQAKRERYWQACQHVWVSQPKDFEQVSRVLPPDRIYKLGRGINFETFSPQKRNRPHLEQTYGIPTDQFLLLLVGRLDACKNVMVFAQAVQILLAQGLPVHAVVAGHGSGAATLESTLGDHVSMLGNIPHPQLGAVFASCDVFVFPSETEIAANVVVEAKASGLPVLVAAQGGAQQHVQVSGEDGLIIPDNHPQTWANTLLKLYHHPDDLVRMGERGAQLIRAQWPSWQQVLAQDLLPTWQQIQL